MRKLFLSAAAVAVVLVSCATDDEYYYGYARAYRTLPDGFEEVAVGDRSYWHHGGRFYRHDESRGYLLVRPPRGAAQAMAATAPPPDPSGPAVATASGGASGGLFDPGVLKKRGRPRNVGRSPLRRGRIGGD